VGLCPTVSKPVAGNDIDAEAKSLIVHTQIGREPARSG
jgi:hypothetical protein